jgi:cation transport protein ChaC
VRYRGTPGAPGLVLGLDAAADGWCDGVAFRVAADQAAAVHDYLSARELVTYAYREARLPVRLDDGRGVEALAYVIDPDHAQYAGALSAEEQAAVIARSVGPMGPNCDYLWNTARHLRDIGVEDGEIEALAARVRTLRNSGSADGVI